MCVRSEMRMPKIEVLHRQEVSPAGMVTVTGISCTGFKSLMIIEALQAAAASCARQCLRQTRSCKLQGEALDAHTPYLWHRLELSQQAVVQQLFRPCPLLASRSNVQQPAPRTKRAAHTTRDHFGVYCINKAAHYFYCCSTKQSLLARKQ